MHVKGRDSVKTEWRWLWTRCW